MGPGHISVLLAEVLDNLRVSEGGLCLLDATFGGGGHTRAFLEAHPENVVWALDCDPEAEPRAEFLGREFGERFQFRALNFAQLDALPESVRFDAALFDLGLSSFHYDQPERGFSFRFAGPADMRLDTRKGQTAAEFLQTATRQELVHAIRDYGEEGRWRRVVDAIWSSRGRDVLNRTETLAALVRDAVGPTGPHGRSPIDPATRTFQGIRIAVNRELEVLENALPLAFGRLRTGGRMAVISFHSLEDRIVKRFFRRMAGQPEHRHDDRPQQERTVYAEQLTRRPVQPQADEIEQNPRSRSARMRVLEKTADL